MNVYDFTVTAQDGSQVALKDYAGKVLLIVNTATACGFTPQYGPMQEIYDEFHDKGLEILDFPCNQFGNQAPGEDEEIHSFCQGRFGITFPQFSKIDVNGDDAIPLYKYLTTATTFEGFGKSPMALMMAGVAKKMDKDYKNNGNIKWNFTKFLIDREGNIKARFEPTADMKLVRDTCLKGGAPAAQAGFSCPFGAIHLLRTLGRGDCGPPLPVAEEGGTESPQPHRFSGRLQCLHGNGKCGKAGKYGSSHISANPVSPSHGLAGDRPCQPSAQVAITDCSPLWLQTCPRHVCLTRRALLGKGAKRALNKLTAFALGKGPFFEITTGKGIQPWKQKTAHKPITRCCSTASSAFRSMPARARWSSATAPSWTTSA